MSSICFFRLTLSPPHPLLALFSFLLLFAFFVRYRLVPGVSNGKRPPRAAVLFRLPQENPLVAPAKSYLEVAGASWIQRVLGCSLGTTPFPPLIWGICNALCNTVRFEGTSKQVFACILHVSLVLHASGWLHQQNTCYVCMYACFIRLILHDISLGYSYLRKSGQYCRYYCKM